MNRRGAVLFFHPMVNGICSPLITDFGLEGAAGTTIEDTVVVLQMIVRADSASLSKYKNDNTSFGRIDSDAAQSHGQSGCCDEPRAARKTQRDCPQILV